MPAADIVHIRVPPEILQKLDANIGALKAQGIKSTRSKLIQSILRERLVTSPHAVTSHDVFSQVLLQKIVRKVALRVLKHTTTALPIIVDEVVHELLTEDDKQLKAAG